MEVGLGRGARHVWSPPKNPPKVSEAGGDSGGTAWLCPRHCPLLVSVPLQTG